MNQKEKEERFLLYKKILEKEPELLKRIQKVETKQVLDDASRLYLYAIVPMLTGFVQWVLEDAKKKNRNRLYFLSRDGYQMYLLAKKMNQDLGYEIDCRYLNVSRYSMRIPEYHLSLDRAIDYMCVNGIDVTLKKILSRASLTPPQIDEVLEETGLGQDADRILGYREIVALRNQLKASPRLAEYIMQYSSAAFDTAMSYLEQEGLLDDNDFALVDSGWIGTLQQSIENLLKTYNDEARAEGYYFGMYEIAKGCDRDKYHCYYFSAEKGIKRKKYFSNSLFETIVSSDEGMTEKYERREGEGVVPVKNEKGNPNREQMLGNIQALQWFLTDGQMTRNDPKTMYQITEELVKLFMAKPSMLEVEAYGNNLFSDDIIDENRKYVAAKLSEQEIKDQRFVSKLLITLKLKKAEIHESAWLEGSVVRNGVQVKKNLWHVRFYKAFLNFRKEMQYRLHKS